MAYPGDVPLDLFDVLSTREPLQNFTGLNIVFLTITSLTFSPLRNTLAYEVTSILTLRLHITLEQKTNNQRQNRY